MALKYPHEVSGGEKQRAIIGLAFSCDPELILFDEPTSALDATTAVNILDLFRDIQKRTGVSALFISHDLGVVREIAHRVAVFMLGVFWRSLTIIVCTKSPGIRIPALYLLVCLSPL